ncbi:MAG: aminopeptidase, partial [candidate division Zixibacteria bacterium]|nr:aminopeptidase [candidate division Zixibacteria bacterium]
MTKLERAAKVAVNSCMFIKEGETVLIIVDEPKRKIGEVLFTASKKAGAEVLMVEIIPRDADGEEPPKPVADLMKKVDVVMAPTSRSLSHTNARRAATRAGVRVATLPGITEETMTRALNADYEKVAKRSNTLAKLLSKGNSARITTPSG